MATGSGFQQSAVEAAERYHDHMWTFCSEQIASLVDSVVTADDHVLDVACGTGFAALQAAHVLGNTGRIVGTDINPVMLSIARSTSGEGPAITWVEASALDLPFDDDEFDVVLCAQSVQFLPDIPRGLREMSRVTRPGGRIAITVWTSRPQSPFLDAQMEMLIEHCGIDPTVPNGAFIDGGADHVRQWFTDAGIPQVDIAVLETTVDLPPADVFSRAHLRALPWSRPFFELPEPRQQAAVDFVADRLAEYRTDSGMSVPFSAYLAIATA